MSKESCRANDRQTAGRDSKKNGDNKISQIQKYNYMLNVVTENRIWTEENAVHIE